MMCNTNWPRINKKSEKNKSKWEGEEKITKFTHFGHSVQIEKIGISIKGPTEELKRRENKITTIGM